MSPFSSRKPHLCAFCVPFNCVYVVSSLGIIIALLLMVLLFCCSKPRLIWKSPTCWYVLPPQPFAIVNGVPVQLANTSSPLFASPSLPSINALTPSFLQFTCDLISVRLGPRIIIFLPLTNSSVFWSMPMKSACGTDTSGVGLRTTARAVGPPV